MSRKPLIGITPTPAEDPVNRHPFERYALASTYTTAIEAAGGVPLIIPPQEGNIDQLLDLVDGLLISGGGDIAPKRFGDDVQHPKTSGVHQGRDDLELALVQGALERDMPMLCICRGIQVLNVTCGGNLYQDIADQYGQSINHQQQKDEVPRQDPSHTVAAEPGTLLSRVYGDGDIHVNSFHHQALRELGAGLRVNATAPDGLIEAVDHPGYRWVLGVQWHPEAMYRAHPEQLAPFEALTTACRERAVV